MTTFLWASRYGAIVVTLRMFDREGKMSRFSVGLTIALFSYMFVCTPTAEASSLRCDEASSYIFDCAQTAETDELRCDDANVVVRSPNMADAKTICEGATDAIRFLGAQGFETNGEIEVVLVDKIPDLIGSSAFGGYVHSHRRAYMLTYFETAKQGTSFDLPFDRLLYRSIAAHEVAHVIAAANFRMSKPQIEAQEYIAYVTMFATMPAMYREQLLGRFVGMEFQDEMQINTIIYLFDPFRFGILAYKHFKKPGNGADFLQQIITSNVLAGSAY
jgi:hypothetical protein